MPTLAYHFTHIEHLGTILDLGLQSDTRAQSRGLLQTEIGNVTIKERRRRRRVAVYPGTVVADYVPFYFAPCSPMLYAIRMRNVPTYSGGQNEIIYLVTSLEAVRGAGRKFVVSDRNAVLDLAAFFTDDVSIDARVDWPLMQERDWASTATDPDRAERRMAEMLVHEHVPVECILGIVAKTEDTIRTVRDELGSRGIELFTDVRAHWYF